MNTTTTPRGFFVSRLEELIEKQDRGALATLRRGLGRQPGSVREMDPYVLKYIPAGTPEYRENAYYLAAALFAEWHQGKEQLSSNPRGNFGGSLRLLVERETNDGSTQEEVEKRIEKRLIALLNCHREDLPEHLRHLTSLLKSHDVPVNWTQLLKDILNWSSEKRWVQRNWSRSFWNAYPDRNNREQTVNNKEEQ